MDAQMTTTPRVYVARPVNPVEAVFWDESPDAETAIKDWCPDATLETNALGDKYFIIPSPTRTSTRCVFSGYWIVKHDTGAYGVMIDHLFRSRYVVPVS